MKDNSYEILNDCIDYDIDYLDKKIEDYKTKKFDLIIHNSINHLVDEILRICQILFLNKNDEYYSENIFISRE